MFNNVNVVSIFIDRAAKAEDGTPIHRIEQ